MHRNHLLASYQTTLRDFFLNYEKKDDAEANQTWRQHIQKIQCTLSTTGGVTLSFPPQFAEENRRIALQLAKNFFDEPVVSENPLIIHITIEKIKELSLQSTAIRFGPGGLPPRLFNALNIATTSIATTGRRLSSEVKNTLPSFEGQFFITALPKTSKREVAEKKNVVFPYLSQEVLLNVLKNFEKELHKQQEPFPAELIKAGKYSQLSNPQLNAFYREVIEKITRRCEGTSREDGTCRLDDYLKVLNDVNVSTSSVKIRR
jgi:hypothetical protein